MNLRSPSFPNGLEGLRTENEARGLTMLDVIRNGAHIGMSDDQLDNEHRAQKRLYAAWDEFCKAVLEVNTASSITEINLSEVEAFAHDTIPDERAWDELIARARS